MKLWYDRKSKDPTCFVQLGIRNGKKTTTKNIARIGRHSELLKITDDPLSYAKEQVTKYNEEAKKNNQVSLGLKINFAEKLKASNAAASSSKQLNIGCFFLQQLYHDLEIRSFFDAVTAGSKFTFAPNLVNRFLTCSRILHPVGLGSLHIRNFNSMGGRTFVVAQSIKKLSDTKSAFALRYFCNHLHDFILHADRCSFNLCVLCAVYFMLASFLSSIISDTSFFLCCVGGF